MGLILRNRLPKVDIDANDSSDVNYFKREIDRISRILSDHPYEFTLPSLSSSQYSLRPAMDIVESDKGYKVSLELPAMDIEDLDISINEHYLTVKGEKKEEKEERDEKDVLMCSERCYGSYHRTITLPKDADTDKAEAIFKKGVLHIDIPKKVESQAKSRKVKIQNIS